jgi:cyclopropane fatty-acyl-phospholipid synthase-like methyltransferase
MTDKTLLAYDEHAEEWAETRTFSDYWREDREWLFLHLEPGDRVIEFGVGTGNEGVRFIRAGLDYTGVDGSAGMLNLARRLIPVERLRLMDLRDVGLGDGESPFDGFWSAATLLHIPKGEVRDVLRRIRGMLRDKAPGFVTVKDGAGESWDDSLPSPRFFSYWDQGEFAEVLRECGFAVEDARSEANGPGKTPWHCYRVRCA